MRNRFKTGLHYEQIKNPIYCIFYTTGKGARAMELMAASEAEALRIFHDEAPEAHIYKITPKVQYDPWIPYQAENQLWTIAEIRESIEAGEAIPEDVLGEPLAWWEGGHRYELWYAYIAPVPGIKGQLNVHCNRDGVRISLQCMRGAVARLQKIKAEQDRSIEALYK